MAILFLILQTSSEFESNALFLPKRQKF